MMKSKKTRKIFLVLLLVFGILVLLVFGYLLYLIIDYTRIEDKAVIPIREGTIQTAVVGETYTALSYNIGFAAYTPQFSFFMDGGTESRAASEESVYAVMNGICALLTEQDADIILLQEVDERATRSYLVDERAILEKHLSGYDAVYAVNWDSSYLLFPLHKPHGKTRSGMLSLSRLSIDDSIRRSLPVETSWMKFVDFDRCYNVSSIPVNNGRELLVYTVHLSAYTSDGTIATEQLEMLIKDMQQQFEAGNYVLCGGDFNKDMLGTSGAYFGIPAEEYTWAQSFPEELLVGTGLSLVKPLEDSAPIPSCRNADAPYYEGQYVLTVDGFIVSNNISVLESIVLDTGFAYSDHNPVRLGFVLDPVSR